MFDRVRMAKTGGKTQAKPINPNEVSQSRSQY